MIFVLGVDAAALGRQREFVSPRADVATDPLLADPVVGRGVDEVDAGIEHGIEESLGRFVADHADAPSPRAAQSHAAVAELGDLQTGAAQRLLSQHCFCSLLIDVLLNSLTGLNRADGVEYLAADGRDFQLGSPTTYAPVATTATVGVRRRAVGEACRVLRFGDDRT